MKLLGKLYIGHDGQMYIHAKSDGRFYHVSPSGKWYLMGRVVRPLFHWRLIGDSYAKD